MEKLPNPEKAFIDLNKLIGYYLNPEHPEGQHKALVFKSTLNIGFLVPTRRVGTSEMF
jgi:hypothetical protein